MAFLTSVQILLMLPAKESYFRNLAPVGNNEPPNVKVVGLLLCASAPLKIMMRHMDERKTKRGRAGRRH